MNNKIYSYEDMEKLQQKIHKIKKKKILEEIRDIIITNNSSIKITENSYGIYLCFNQLSNDTFIKLDKIVKKHHEEEEKNKTNSSYILQTTEENNDYYYDNNSRLKYSNKEKNLIKKKLYDKALKLNSELNDYENNYSSELKSDTGDSIFIKKVDKK